MSRRDRELQEADLRSDPEDDDYDDRAAPTSAKKRKVARPSSGAGVKARTKRRRRNTSVNDILASDDEDDDLSIDDSVSGESVTVERTVTGRPKRAVTKKTATLKESTDDEDADELEAIEDIESEHSSPQSRRPRSTSQQRSSDQRATGRRSLVVKLPIRLDPETNMVETRRIGDRGAKAAKGVESHRRPGTRRSSRQSEGELFELTNSGRHAQPVSNKSVTPEPIAGRQTRGAKRIPGTGAIIEASQEDSQASLRAGVNEELETAEGLTADVGDIDDEINISEPMLAVSNEDAIVAESVRTTRDEGSDENVDDDDDDEPVRTGRTRQASKSEGRSRDTRHSGRQTRKGVQESSDFNPEDLEEPEDDHISGSESPQKASQRSEASSTGRRSGRLAGLKRKRVQPPTSRSEEDSDDIDRDELAEEARDLSRKRRKRQPILYEPLGKRRTRGAQPDYRIFKPEILHDSDEDQPAKPTQTYRRGRGGGPYRSLLSTIGPFGGAGGPSALLGGPEGAGAAGGADSDSSDDDNPAKTKQNMGGAVGMTPTSAMPHGILPQSLNADPAQAASGTGPAGFGKVNKDKKALADVDPLGVDHTVSFEGVGGLDNHINQLKEMVALPLLYPEIFQQFKVTPPRGVLFHGPPGTGKTLLARALAASVSSQGRKVTFYMRKGADALSKWVGEAERQLRLLFEEARKNQPSIIFFDEIDGLAPVRSSKQEQIHASIVATLLALMDGMDGRGQVVVIGATNRPDSVDPALRRPGRFDREFYFPLPNKAGRLAIIDIHTKQWSPPLQASFKEQVAELTKGYGGADLRALCTEAALNAVQGTYPQIYKSDEKLVIDTSKIKIRPKDFMISLGKMIPSSERTGSASAAPLEGSVEPLLRASLAQIASLLDEVLPERPKRTALEEAEFDDRDDEMGFQRETLQQEFDRARVYRPRLLIEGLQGMGQQYLGAAVLHKFERLHVQSFDLPTLFNDATRTPEAAVVQLFNEVRRHKPSVIFIPDINTWYTSVGSAVVKLFSGLLRALPPNDPVLLLGVMELHSEADKPDEQMLRDLFSFSAKNRYQMTRPRDVERREFFEKVIAMIRSAPTALPDPKERKRRQIPQLEVAPAEPSPGPSKADLKARKKQDMHCLNTLKIQIQPIMDHIKNKYKKFRNPTIDESRIAYLFEEQDSAMVTTDVPGDRQEQARPFELKQDAKGVPGLLETETGEFYYNIEIVTIERRLSNGYYKRLKDFLADIKRLAKDAKTSGDEERILKANELVANVEVDIQFMEANLPGLVSQCEEVYMREKERQELQQADGDPFKGHVRSPRLPLQPSGSTSQTTGPIILGEPVPGRLHIPGAPQTRPIQTSQHTNGDSTSPGHAHMEGESRPDQGDEDVLMGNSQGEHDRPQDPALAQSNQTQRSQKSALTTMAYNSQPGDYQNSASTTTSGQKTSDKSTRSSDRYHNTQSSNGAGKEEHQPDFSELQEYSGQSQLPDTQEVQQSSSQSVPDQQPMGPPLSRQATSLGHILNVTEPQPKLILDESILMSLHDNIVSRSSGCSVEQLEQVNAVLMDAVWKQRSQWNRTLLTSTVGHAFNKVIKDIDETQSILTNTQSSGRSVGDDLD